MAVTRAELWARLSFDRLGDVDGRAVGFDGRHLVVDVPTTSAVQDLARPGARIAVSFGVDADALHRVPARVVATGPAADGHRLVTVRIYEVSRPPQRIAPRTRLAHRVWIQQGAGGHVRGTTIDLSVTGMAVHTDERLFVHVPVGITMRAATVGARGDLTVTGTVVYSRRDGAAWRSGVEFMVLSASAISQIGHLLDAVHRTAPRGTDPVPAGRPR